MLAFYCRLKWHDMEQVNVHESMNQKAIYLCYFNCCLLLLFFFFVFFSSALCSLFTVGAKEKKIRRRRRKRNKEMQMSVDFKRFALLFVVLLFLLLCGYSLLLLNQLVLFLSFDAHYLFSPLHNLSDQPWTWTLINSLTSAQHLEPRCYIITIFANCKHQSKKRQ